MRIAVTREISPRIAECELTHIAREPIDVELAQVQHAEFELWLESLGCIVRRAAPEPDLPDSVFVEDTAVVFDELALMARPGAESRRAEVRSIAEDLGRYRDLRFIEAPATLDGGDVLRVGRSVWVGVTRRTSADAAEGLKRLLAPYGYRVHAVPVEACLHLKSAATEVSDRGVLINPAWVDGKLFEDVVVTLVDPGEPYGANVLRVGDVLLCSAAHPRTRERLERLGHETRAVDLSELAKAEGALTCCSIIFET
jgi:dimethylargininase